MPLVRIAHQARWESQPSLEEWFEETSPGMVAVLHLLEDALGLKEVFRFTSHRNLVLLDQDDRMCPWRVVVGTNPGVYPFYVECLIPEALAPWPSARARAEVRTADEAVQRIIAGMRYSQGWTDVDLLPED